MPYRRTLQGIATVVLCLWLAVAQAYAGCSMLLCGAGSSGGGAPAFQGPGDIVSGATAWYGLRAFSSAKRGTKAINLCDNAGANCTDISTDAVTGKLNNPGTLGANNCATSNTCLIKIWYDQSGALSCGGSACDESQATNANMATLTFSCVNSLPCAVFAGAQFYVSPATLASWASGTISAVANRTGAFTSAGNIASYGPNTGSANLNFRQVASAVQMFQGTGGIFISNITDSNYHAFQAAFNAASSDLMCGGSAGTSCSNAGVSNSLSPGSSAVSSSATICIGAQQQAASSTCLATNSPLTGQLTEVGVWNGTVFTGTQQTNMNANQITAWGPF